MVGPEIQAERGRKPGQEGREGLAVFSQLVKQKESGEARKLFGPEAEVEDVRRTISGVGQMGMMTRNVCDEGQRGACH